MSGNYKGKHVDRSHRYMILAAGILAAAAIAAVLILHPWDTAAPGQDAGSDPRPEGSAGLASASDPAGSSSQPVQAPAADPVPQLPPYDFSQPAPETEAVDNSYFADAAFIGDSRTNGFMLYSGVGCGEDLSANGISMFRLEERKALTIDGKELTLLEALALKEYGKVYISLGINELGYSNDRGFYEAYSSAIDHIRRLQPNAVIYIQALIPVNIAQVEASNGNKYQLSNDHLRVYNDLLRQVAEEKQVVFLDLYSDFAGEDGELPAEYSRDGVHMVKEACEKWLAYLQTHTVSFEELYPNGPPIPDAEAPGEPEPDASEEGTAPEEAPGAPEEGIAADGSIQG